MSIEVIPYFYCYEVPINICFGFVYLIFRTLEEEETGDTVEINCSRERSRTAWKIIEEVLTWNVQQKCFCDNNFLKECVSYWFVYNIFSKWCVLVINLSMSLFHWLLQYLKPFVEKERYQISKSCRLHADNDLYRDQEQHKIHIDVNEWKCGYCRKSFYEEKYLDKHFDRRHRNLLNVVSTKS